MTSACRGRPWWGNKASQSGRRVWAAKFLVSVARQHHRHPSPPPQKENIRAEGQRMVEVQRETYSKRRERLAGCQMPRCSEA